MARCQTTLSHCHLPDLGICLRAGSEIRLLRNETPAPKKRNPIVRKRNPDNRERSPKKLCQGPFFTFFSTRPLDAAVEPPAACRFSASRAPVYPLEHWRSRFWSGAHEITTKAQNASSASSMLTLLCRSLANSEGKPRLLQKKFPSFASSDSSWFPV